jgi:peptide methionine sulfoxide reductase MsrA
MRAAAPPNPARSTVSHRALLKLLGELHNPVQGMQQGNDVGSTL